MGDLKFWPQPSGLIPDATLCSIAISLASSNEELWSLGELRIAELISRIQPNKHSEVRRSAVCNYIQGLIRKCFDCQVFTFGSVPLKTYLPDGDIDLTAFSRHLYLRDTWTNYVKSILEAEEQNQNAEFCVTDVQCINADVKIVKCLVENIVVDISFNQLGGLCTLCFLDEVDMLIGKNHLFKRSIILVKAWCYYESRLLGAHHGLISTYALETLVLYIFHVFHASLRGPLEVLFRFLDYFSNFDWNSYCLSLWGPIPLSNPMDMSAEPPRKDGGELLLSKAFLEACSDVYAVIPKSQINLTHTFVPKYLNVVDPLRTDNNLGRSVSKANFHRIRSALSFGARSLVKLFESPKSEFPKNLDNFFSSTWQRQHSCWHPDVPEPTPCEHADVMGDGESTLSLKPSSKSPSKIDVENYLQNTEALSLQTHPQITDELSACVEEDDNMFKLGSNSSNTKLNLTIREISSPSRSVEVVSVVSKHTSRLRSETYEANQESSTCPTYFLMSQDMDKGSSVVSAVSVGQMSKLGDISEPNAFSKDKPAGVTKDFTHLNPVDRGVGSQKLNPSFRHDVNVEGIKGKFASDSYYITSVSTPDHGRETPRNNKVQARGNDFNCKFSDDPTLSSPYISSLPLKVQINSGSNEQGSNSQLGIKQEEHISISSPLLSIHPSFPHIYGPVSIPSAETEILQDARSGIVGSRDNKPMLQVVSISQTSDSPVAVPDPVVKLTLSPAASSIVNGVVSSDVESPPGATQLLHITDSSSVMHPISYVPNQHVSVIPPVLGDCSHGFHSSLTEMSSMVIDFSQGSISVMENLSAQPSIYFSAGQSFYPLSLYNAVSSVHSSPDNKHHLSVVSTPIPQEDGMDKIFHDIKGYRLRNGMPIGFDLAERSKADGLMINSNLLLKMDIPHENFDGSQTEVTLDLLDSDFDSHLHNLNFGRYCQDPAPHTILLPPPVVQIPNYVHSYHMWEGPGRPVHGVGSLNGFVPSGPLVKGFPHINANFINVFPGSYNYNFGFEDFPRHRNGTGTYLPSLRHGTNSGRQTLITRNNLGIYNHEQDHNRAVEHNLKSRGMGHRLSHEGHSHARKSFNTRSERYFGEAKYRHENAVKKYLRGPETLQNSTVERGIVPHSLYGNFPHAAIQERQALPTFSTSESYPNAIFSHTLEFGSFGPLKLGEILPDQSPSIPNNRRTNTSSLSVSDRGSQELASPMGQQRINQRTYQHREEDFPPLSFHVQKGSGSAVVESRKARSSGRQQAHLSTPK